MKKLNLQLGSIKEMLSKEQMKKIAGGYDCSPTGFGTPWECYCPSNITGQDYSDYYCEQGPASMYAPLEDGSWCGINEDFTRVYFECNPQ